MELLAVIVVLGLIGLVTIPVVNKIIKDSKVQLYQEQIRMLEENAKKWGTKNDDMLPSEGNVLALSFQDIQKEGLLEKGDIKDPRSGEQLKGCIYVQYDNEYNQYLYDYKEDCDPSMGLWKAPIITVNGKTIGHTITLAVTESYTIPEGTAVDYEGNPVAVTTEGNVSPDIPGKYQIVYKATDKKGITGALVLTINVIDTSVPTVDYIINTTATNGWYNSNVTITLSGSDKGFSPRNYEYQINTGSGYSNWNTVSGNSFTITNEGSNITFKVRSKSRNSIYSEIKESPTIKIDKTKPEVASTVLSETNETEGPVTITITGQDSLSGIKEYSFDEGLTWSSENTKSFDENKIVYVMVKDKAGNTSTSKGVMITNIKVVKPTIDYAVVGTPFNENGWADNNFYIEIKPNVGSSGIKEVKYCKTTESSCTPNITVSKDNLSVLIDSENNNNKICSIVTNHKNQSSEVKCSGSYKLDKGSPNITAKASSYTVTQGDSVDTKTYFNITYGISGGSTSCNVSNTSSLAVGTTTVTCTSTGLNKKSSSASTSVTVKAKAPTTLTPGDVVNNGINGGGLEQIGDTYYFRGSSPKNWVKFNDELWRIISIEDGLMKIIRNTIIESQAWDTSGTYGSNQWNRPADIKTYLNETFYNTLSAKAKGQMQDGAFNIGVVNYDTKSTAAQVKANEMSTVWVGKVGLMNASDYAYSSKTDDSSTSSCINKAQNNTDCKNGWLYSGKNEWTINASSHHSGDVFYVTAGGELFDSYGYSGANLKLSVRPVIFLRSDVSITPGGKGTANLPYVIQ